MAGIDPASHRLTCSARAPSPIARASAVCDSIPAALRARAMAPPIARASACRVMHAALAAPAPRAHHGRMGFRLSPRTVRILRALKRRADARNELRASSPKHLAKRIRVSRGALLGALDELVKSGLARVSWARWEDARRVRRTRDIAA